MVRPGDPGYEAARIGWNRLYSRYPEAIVFCCDAHEVANAVEWAREEGIALRARSGRHSLEGWSSLDGGLVVDVSRMKSVTILLRAERVARLKRRFIACDGWRTASSIYSNAGFRHIE